MTKFKVKNYKTNKVLKIINLVIGICLIFGIWNLEFLSIANAQSTTLSISPPINEVTIIPGKEATINYELSNFGFDNQITVRILAFVPDGDTGNVKLDESKDYLKNGFFKLISPTLNDSGTFPLLGDSKQNIVLKITPPEDLAEGDYYYTILFATVPNNVGATNSTDSKIEIGSNILVNISKTGNPVRKADILEFTALKIVDSFQSINFNIILNNLGNSFFKPKGKIEISDSLKNNQILNIAPQNILVNTPRKVQCLNGEDVVNCKATGFHFGIVKSQLIFTAGDDPTIYTQTLTTYALPIYAIIIILLLISFFKLFKKYSNA